MYTKVKIRQKRNEVLTLKDKDGDWVEGQYQEKDLLVESLKDIFHSGQDIAQKNDLDMVLRELDLPQLSPIQVCHLQRPISDGDIKCAMFSMDNSKSPGPEGFTTAFFKLHWNIVERSVCDAVKNF